MTFDETLAMALSRLARLGIYVTELQLKPNYFDQLMDETSIKGSGGEIISRYSNDGITINYPSAVGRVKITKRL